MDPLERRAIGKTDVRVTCLGFGGGALGDLWEVTPEAQADATVAAAWEGGIRYFDTAPFYGHTKSEHRVGRNLRVHPRDEFVVSSKVGRVYFHPGPSKAYEPGIWAAGLPFNFRVDYTRDGVLRSYEDSLMRLGLNRVDALLIHDLDFTFHRTEAAVQDRLRELDEGGGFAALRDLRDQGEIGVVGAGINEVGMIPRFLERFDLDLFIVALPYTLLDQPALDRELPLCVERGVSVVIGAPFASGILAGGPDSGATYAYAPAPPEVLERTRRIQAVCARHGVPLGTAALQFPLAHPAVAAVIPGPNAPEQARQNLEWVRARIPADLWSELKADGLLRPDAPTP